MQVTYTVFPSPSINWKPILSMDHWIYICIMVLIDVKILRNSPRKMLFLPHIKPWVPISSRFTQVFIFYTFGISANASRRHHKFQGRNDLLIISKALLRWHFQTTAYFVDGENQKDVQSSSSAMVACCLGWGSLY